MSAFVSIRMELPNTRERRSEVAEGFAYTLAGSVGPFTGRDT